jgi:hypothetical protein
MPVLQNHSPEEDTPVSIFRITEMFGPVRWLAHGPFSSTARTGYSSNDAVKNHHVTFALLEPLIKPPAHKRCKWMPCAKARYITRNSFATREVNRAHPSQTKATQKHFSTQSSPISEKKLCFLKSSQASSVCFCQEQHVDKYECGALVERY